MAWRVAKSLQTLLAEINAIAPNRSKASDGSIGDAAHQGRGSDHNPNWSNVVCARDFTHDPAHGADMNQLSKQLVARKHNCLKYVIWNRRIATRGNGFRWEAYYGSNPHNHHMHVSVGRGSDGASTGPYDDTTPWGISGGSTLGDDLIGLKKGASGGAVDALQRILGYAGYPVTVDGDYGANTAKALLRLRKDMGSTADDGDEVTGTAYAQLHKALAIAMAEKYGKGDRGPAGPAGPAGKDGKDGVVPKGTVITSTVT